MYNDDRSFNGAVAFICHIESIFVCNYFFRLRKKGVMTEYDDYLK